MSDDEKQKWEELDKRLSDMEANIFSFNENVTALANIVGRVEKILEEARQEGASGLLMHRQGDDELYETARELVIKKGKASTSYLQRRLSIGYGRAAYLLDALEEKGVVGPSNGKRTREVLK